MDILTILKELHRISGFRVTVHDADYHEIAAYPEALSPFCTFVRQQGNCASVCQSCSRSAFDAVNKTGEVQLYRCKFGLWEAVSPLYHFGVLTGYLMMGQVIDDTAENRKQVSRCSQSYIPDTDSVEEMIDKIPIVTSDLIEAYVNMMTICANYITYSNLLTLPERDLAELTMKYIHRNFTNRLTIKELCAYFHCSKSTLINSFEQRYHISVNKYITKIRLKQAKSLLARATLPSAIFLCNADLPIKDIFPRYFKKIYI